MQSARIGVAVFCLWASGAQAATFAYTLTDLGSLGGDTYALGLNDAGLVVGQSGSDAFVHDGTTMTLLPGTPGSSGATARAVSAFGQVVGDSRIAGFPTATRWDGTTATGLGGLGAATDINITGDIVGVMQTGATVTDAILWRSTGGYEDLGQLAGGTDTSVATAINDVGQIVGSSDTAGGAHAFVWDDVNGMRDLNSLVSPTGGAVLTAAEDINDSGAVVGTSFDGVTTSAFFWDGVDYVDIGFVDPLSAYSIASAVNGAGTVVGSSGLIGSETAFLWSQADGLVDLNSLIDPLLGWSLLGATDINASGQITGYGTTGTGVIQAFVLTPTAPVPLPASFGLLLAGGTGLGALRLRKRRA